MTDSEKKSITETCVVPEPSMEITNDKTFFLNVDFFLHATTRDSYATKPNDELTFRNENQKYKIILKKAQRKSLKFQA